MKTPLRPTNKGSILKLFLILIFIGLAFVLSVGAMIYVSVRPNRDFRDLQDVVLSELDQNPNMRVSVRAPSLLISAARFGLSFVDDVDAEALLALQAIRGGQVGVFQLPHPVSRSNKSRILNRSNETMEDNGWTRIAAVVERDDMVLVYAPTDIEDPSDLEILTLVLSNSELVIASARGDLRPLWELVRPHISEVSEDLSREFN